MKISLAKTNTHSGQKIQDAYDRLARLHSAGRLDGESEIVIGAGKWLLEKPLHFYGDFPVVIHGEEGKEAPVLYGGIRLDKWQAATLNARAVQKASVPEDVDEIPFMCVGDTIRRPAVWPKKGFLSIPKIGDEQWTPMTSPEQEGSFPVNRGDFNPQWHDLKNILIQMCHLWHEENLRVDSYDATSDRVILRSGLMRPALSTNTEYRCFNVREALTEPGEFYFDRKEHAIYRIPEETESEWYLPLLGAMIRIDSGAKNIALRHLELKYGGAYLPVNQPNFDLRDNGFRPIQNGTMSKQEFKEMTAGRKLKFLQSGQGSQHLPGIIMMDHASDCTIDRCKVTACGWYAVCMAQDCHKIAVRNCLFNEMGGGGIFAGGLPPVLRKRKDDGDVSNLEIVNNHLHHLGKIHLSGMGVFLTFVHHCLVEHNDIHDLYYSGISCGWTWGFFPTPTCENRIGWNRIHDIGKGILSDMGGIYLLGVQPGTHVYNNVIFNIQSHYYGGWGLYTDEGSSHIVLENNLAYDCSCEGFHQHYGRENIVRGNIFAFCKDAGVAYTNTNTNGLEGPGKPRYTHGVTLLGNVIVTAGQPFYRLDAKALYDDRILCCDCNFFESTAEQKSFALLDGGKLSCAMADWQKNGYDRHSICGKAGFVNAAKRDFRLKKNSPLLLFGFIPWDFSAAGLL
ncbi:MAG: right-handed parallel beta-helix repeat-containing protein [Lentisphaeria bacterium]|nr:right-handed parallel beta-helix repeat-containing protein [Lentisphaeria bacterium]